MSKVVPISTGLDRAESVASILLVDDRPANLLALEAVLEPMLQKLVRASSGEEALERIAETDFAVILMDVRMPKMDGLRVLELMNQREKAARVPVILLTAVGLDAGEIARGYERGAVDLLLKPFDPSILRSKVAVFVDLFLKEQTIKRQAAMLRQRDRETMERRSEQRFRGLMDALPQCVWATNIEWEVYYANRQAVDYTGLQIDQPTPIKEVLAVLHPEDRIELESKVDTIGMLKKPVEVQVRLRRNSDGVYRWFLMRGVPQTDESSKITGWIVAGTDIDVERHALQAAESASQMKEEFLALVSHELRNPLNAIKGWTHLLRMGSLDTSRTYKALETIERNVELQTSLIDDILDVSNIVRGKLNLNMRSQRISAILESALAAIRPAAQAKDIELLYVSNTVRDTVSGDADRLQQVFWNLLSNAMKFTPRGGKVTVTLDVRGSDVSVAVADTGRGISPDFLPYVFERFRQGETGTTRSNGGLGLGLAIARQIVELHGGLVSAESAGQDRGATFTALIPLMEPHASDEQATPARTSGRQLPLRDVSVLLVDDQPDSRELLSEVLALFGANTSMASSVQQALNDIIRNRPHVLVSDIAMPAMDGYELIRRVREIIPAEAMPAIALTGLSRYGEQERAIAAGFQRYVVKPVSPAALIEVILSLVEHTAHAPA